MSNYDSKYRKVSLDITRIIAFLSVPSIHFFLNSGYQELPVIGWKMYVMTIFRNFFMVSVPLFMLLTGYLMVLKDIELEKNSLLRFYSKLLRVIITYILSAGIIILYRMRFSEENISLKKCVSDLLGFQQYSWYVNMYIGLYLLIPLLNKIWRLAEHKEKQLCIVLIFSLLTIAPSIFNIYDFETQEALIHPWISTSYTQIIPNWWNEVYPITYYFIGAYIRTNLDLTKIKTGRIAALLVCSVIFFGIYNIWRSYSVNLIWGLWCDWGSLQNTINTVLLFLLINSARVPSPGKIITRGIKLISELTFSAYILTWIFDQIYYKELKENVPDILARFKYAPYIVLKVSVSSLALSLVVYIVIKYGRKLTVLIGDRNKKMSADT